MAAAMRLAAFVTSTSGLIILAVSAALGGAALFYSSAYSDGRQAEAETTAQAARGAIDTTAAGNRQIDGCYDLGGVWDASHGVCR